MRTVRVLVAVIAAMAVVAPTSPAAQAYPTSPVCSSTTLNPDIDPLNPNPLRAASLSSRYIGVDTATEVAVICRVQTSPYWDPNPYSASIYFQRVCVGINVCNGDSGWICVGYNVCNGDYPSDDICVGANVCNATNSHAGNRVWLTNDNLYTYTTDQRLWLCSAVVWRAGGLTRSWVYDARGYYGAYPQLCDRLH